MPFHPEEKGDLAYVREQRARAVKRAMDKMPFKIGDQVKLKTVPQGMDLVEPEGVVTGYLPAAADAQVTVMCSWGDGQEREVPCMASNLEAPSSNG